MKIFFDARWTRTTRHDGVSRYGASLIEALAALQPITIIIHDTAQLKLLPKNIPYVVLNHPFSLQEFFIARKLNKLGAEVVFTPLQYMGWYGRKYKLIYTLQDLIYYRHPLPPRFLPPYVRLIWRLFHLAYWPQRWILDRADRVATVSQTSKRYIQAHHITNKKIDVVYNAPQAIFSQHTTRKVLTKDLVFMGSFMPYKNTECLIQSLSALPDYTLHLLSPITPERKAELRRLVPKGGTVKFWNGISDEDYSKLLSHATALVSASKDEGFGLPIVEAMAQGVPVICSDIEIFKEVAGESALFFDPNKPERFAEQVRTLEDPAIRAKLMQAGPKQAQKFSWEASATVLLDAFQQLVSIDKSTKKF
jgi:glycosyltransferase involved in cell wall biosynthesis